MANPVRISMLGRFEIASSSRVLIDQTWPRRKALAPIKILALQPDRSMRREALLDALWPGLEPLKAGANLRSNRYYLRNALGRNGQVEDLLVSEGDQLKLGSHISLDIEEFESAARLASDERISAELYKSAIASYGGELLPEDRDDAWTTTSRDALRNLFHQVLSEARRLAEARGDSAASIDYLDMLVLSDPLNEQGHRSLMLAYQRAGQRTRALLQYEVCRKALRGAVEIEPEPETQQLYRRIKEHRLTTSTRVTTSSGPFVGRDDEVREMREAFEEVRGGRGQLILISGEAGMGKTRLAEELAVYAR